MTPSPPLPPTDGTIRILWLVPESSPEVWVQRSVSWMDSAERARWEALRHPPSRRASALGRLMLRRLVADLEGLEPDRVGFALGEHGRPHPVDRAEGSRRLRPVNCAHTAGLVVAASSDLVAPRLGIDCESRSRTPPGRGLDRFFAPEETRNLFALPPEERNRLFWRLWTLKEAWLKARGTGIAGRLSSSRIRFRDPAPPILAAADSEDPTRWTLLEPEVVPGHHVALAIERPPATSPRVRIEAFDPR